MIGLGDFFRHATSIGERDGNLVQMPTFADVAYWNICSTLSVIVDLVQRRNAHG